MMRLCLLLIGILQPLFTAAQINFVLVREKVLPHADAVLWDISEDERYVLMSEERESRPGYLDNLQEESRDFLFVYDLYHEEPVITISSKSRYKLAGARFNNASDKLLLYYEPGGPASSLTKTRIPYQLSISKGKLAVSTYPLPVDGNKEISAFRIFRNLLMVEAERRFYDEEKTMYVMDVNTLQPVKDLSEAITKAFKKAYRSYCLVDDENKSVYVVRVLEPEKSGTDCEIIQFSYSNNSWKKKYTSELKTWDDAAFRGRPEPLNGGDPEYYLTKGGKHIITLSYGGWGWPFKRNRNDGDVQLNVFNTATRKSDRLLFSGKGIGRRIDSLIAALGGLDMDNIRQGYSCGNSGYSGNYPLEVYGLNGDSLTVYKKETERIALEDFTGNTFVRKNNIALVGNLLVNFREGTATQLNLSAALRDISHIESKTLDSFESYELVRQSPFNIATPAKKFEFAGRLICKDKPAKKEELRELHFTFDDHRIDSGWRNCSTNKVFLAAKRQVYETRSDILTDTIMRRYGTNASNAQHYIQELSFESIAYPDVYINTYDNKRISLSLAWNMEHNTVSELYHYTRNGYDGIWRKTRESDSISVFWDMRETVERDPVWATEKRSTTLKLYSYSYQNKRISLLDTLQIGEGDLKINTIGDTYEYYEDLGLAVFVFRYRNRQRVIAYDVSERKRVMDAKIANYGDNDLSKQLTPLIQYILRHKPSSTKSIIDCPLFSTLIYSQFLGGEVCRIDKNEKRVTLATDRQIYFFKFEEGAVQQLNNYNFEGLLNKIDYERQLLTTLTSGQDQVYNIYSLFSGRLLFTADFDEQKVHFEDTSGHFAEFYNINNESPSTSEMLLNRPDLLLSAMNNKDEKTGFLYDRVVKLRQSKLNKIATDATSQPKVEILSSAGMKKLYTATNILKLKIRVTDSLHAIKKYNVWMNGVPIYGISGKPLTLQQNVQELNIQLAEGRNMVQLEVMNESNVWSKRAGYLCYYVPDKQAPSQTYFIGIGMSEYRDSSKMLNASAKDIRDVITAFRSQTTGFDVTDTLINTRLPFRQQLAGIKQKIMQTGINDKVILMLSGHGLLSSDKLSWNFAGYYTDFNHPDTSTTLTYDDIESLFEGIPARNRIIMIDACHAGQSYFEYTNASPFAQADNYAADKTKKDGGEPDIYKDLPFNFVSGFSSFTPAGRFAHIDYEAFKLITEAFPDYNQNGSVVLTASRGEQTAKEGEDNGLFTRSFLKIFNASAPGTLTISRLIAELQKEFAGMEGQKPSIKAFNPAANWLLK